MADQGREDQYGWLYGGDSGRPSDGPGHQPTPSHGRSGGDLPPPNLPPPGGGRRRDGGGGDAPRSGSKRRLGPGRVILILLAAWLLFLVGVPLYAYSTMSKIDAAPDGDRPDRQRGSTYLLVGSDSRSADREEGDRGRTDTIMLLHSGSGPSMMLSLPRDSIVEIPGYGTTKINAAYAYGGPELLVQTIELNTGIRVDDYVEIGFGGLEDVVDAVRGIEICPEDAVKDKDARLDVEAGCQNADGETALAYSRVRKAYGSGDIQRVQNQREVMAGIASKVASPWTFIDPVRYWGVNAGAASSVVVGEEMNPFDIVGFALALRGAMGEDGLSCTVPVADFSVRWDPERSRQLFDLVASDDTAEIGDLCTPDGLPAD